jgi:hypothetical protein
MEQDAIRDSDMAYPLESGRKMEGNHAFQATGKGLEVREQLPTEHPSFPLSPFVLNDQNSQKKLKS